MSNEGVGYRNPRNGAWPCEALCRAQVPLVGSLAPDNARPRVTTVRMLAGHETARSPSSTGMRQRGVECRDGPTDAARMC